MIIDSNEKMSSVKYDVINDDGVRIRGLRIKVKNGPVFILLRLRR